MSESYEAHEDLLGLACVEATDAGNLKSVIYDCLTHCGLSISNCCGQAYDGAANMAGWLSGVATRIQDDEPKALFVHCTAHSVNLCMQECGKQSKVIRDALSLVNEICNFIKLSPKRLSLFEHLQECNSATSPSLKPLCPTRWTVRTSAVLSVLTNYKVLLDELDKIRENETGEASSKATGVCVSMEQFLKLSYLVFS